jgi:hypothetical protein
MTAYTYRRETDGTESHFDILTPEGKPIATTTQFWDGDAEWEAEADAKLICDALNAYKAG